MNAQAAEGQQPASGALFATGSGRVLAVALDHGMTGVKRGLERPLERLEQVMAGGADAVLVSVGLARAARGVLSRHPGVKVIVALDTYATSTSPWMEGETEIHEVVTSVEGAVAAGAVAVKSLLVFGRRDPDVYRRNLRQIRRIRRETEVVGVPWMLEAVGWGAQVPDKVERAPETVAHYCRVAFELGADIVKAPYPGDAAAFRHITGSLPVPIVILGGTRVEEEHLHAITGDAIAGGARGVVFGRNVWQAEKPGLVLSRLRRIVHGPGTGSVAAGGGEAAPTWGRR